MSLPTHTASEVLLQFLAESHQGLNELAGRGTAIDQALSTMTADLLEQVIGSDEPETLWRQRYRNELRAKQRTTLYKYMGTGIVAHLEVKRSDDKSGASDE